MADPSTEFLEWYHSSTPYVYARGFLWTSSVFLNLLIFLPTVLIKDFRKDRFKNLLAQLVLGDIVIALGALIRMYFLYHGMPDATILKCALVELPLMAGYHISHLAVFWISLDRFTAVSFPLMYHKMCTPNVVIYRWALTIFISTVHTSLLLVRNDLSSATPEFCRTSENWKPWCINYLFGFATLLCVANIILYLLTIRKTQSALSSQTEFQKKVYYTFFYIIIVYILFWVIPKAFYFLAKKILAKMPKFSLVSSIFLQINGIADNFMTLGNFAIYGWRHREIRVALRNMPFKKKSVVRYVPPAPRQSSLTPL